MSSTCGRDVRGRLARSSQMSLSRKHRLEAGTLRHHEFNDRQQSSHLLFPCVSHHLSKKSRSPIRVPQGLGSPVQRNQRSNRVLKRSRSHIGVPQWVNLSKGSSPSKARNLFCRGPENQAPIRKSRHVLVWVTLFKVSSPSKARNGLADETRKR
jgi:hypothetical protein